MSNVTTCPSWCNTHSPNPDGLTDDWALHAHRVDAAPGVYAELTQANAHGEVRIYLQQRDGDELTAAEARLAASALLRVADLAQALGHGADAVEGRTGLAVEEGPDFVRFKLPSWLSSERRAELRHHLDVYMAVAPKLLHPDG